MTSMASAHPGRHFADKEWRWLAPLALFALGFWLVPLAHTCRMACVPGDIGDARFNGIILEYFYRWLTGVEVSLINPGFFYPMPGVLSFSDNHWGSAWLYSIFRMLGADRYHSFDLWYLAAYALNFFACHYLLRRMRFSPVASAVGAFLFAYAMPVSIKYGHAQLMYRCLAPVALLFWQRFREQGGWLWLGLVALTITGQFYLSIYLGYFTVLLLGAWALSQAIMEREWPWRLRAESAIHTAFFPRRDLVLALGMMAIAAAGLLWLMYPYLHFSRLYQFHRDSAEIGSMLPRIRSYLLADNSLLWGRLSQWLVPSMPMRQEQQMFLGLGAGLFALSGLFLSKSALRWTALLSIAMLVLLTLSVAGHSAYSLIAVLPGANSIRAVSRIILIMALPAAILVALGVDALRSRGGFSSLAACVLAILMIAEASSVKTMHFEPQEAQGRVQKLRESLPATVPADAVLYVPGSPEEPSFVTELDGMSLAQELGRNTLNGYSGNSAPGYSGDAELPACQQAVNRLRAAAQFYAERLHREPPLQAHALVFIVGHPGCAEASWMRIPIDQLRKVRLQIVSIEPAASDWRVHVRISNGSDYTLPAYPAVQPFRLSWQLHSIATTSPDPAKWVSRIELEAHGGDIEPGQSREVEFIVPGSGADANETLSVSAVLEGRVWLHDLDVAPVSARVE